MEIQEKKVGWLLGIGIFIMPYFFSWILLTKGYSKKARLLGFGWLIIIIASMMMLDDNQPSNSQVKYDVGNTSSKDRETIDRNQRARDGQIPTIVDYEWTLLTDAQYDELERRCLGNYTHETCKRLSDKRNAHETIKDLKQKGKEASEAAERHRKGY